MFASVTPTQFETSDTLPVNLGFRFRSSVPGKVNCIRFYKHVANTGTHIGRLYTSDGTLLGSIAFTNETPSGWQQACFASPIAIQPNTTYVASYYAPRGAYAYTFNYFATSKSRGVLTAPAHTGAQPNGAYKYSSGAAFPNQNWQRSHYWVDVVFTPS